MFMEKGLNRRHAVITVASIGALRLLVKLYRWHSEQARINEFLANHPEPWKGKGYAVRCYFNITKHSLF